MSSNERAESMRCQAARWLVISLAGLPVPVIGATITVDGNLCTLVDAITAANTDGARGGCPVGSGADVVELALDVTLTAAAEPSVHGSPTGLPLITDDLTIEGMGHQIERLASAGLFRIFAVDAGTTLTLRNVIVRNGHSTFGGGGGISNFGTVDLFNSSIFNNSTDRSGGGISSFGVLSLTDSSISSNSAAFEGGGIFTDAGSVVLTRSIVSGNSASTDGGGLFVDFGSVTLSATTVSGNSASRHGGGICNAFGTADLTNVTLSGNSAASDGGGLYTTLQGIASTTLANSIVAKSVGSDNCFGSIVDNGSNLGDDTSCSSIPDTLSGLDPSLADNGGPTMTHALLAASSAIDSGSAASCPMTDQRGVEQVGTCDIGAFEYIPCPDLVLSSETVFGIETRENCQVIQVGPSFAVANSGDLTVRAGKRVELGNGSSVAADGELTIEIDAQLQLTPP